MIDAADDLRHFAVSRVLVARDRCALALHDHTDSAHATAAVLRAIEILGTEIELGEVWWAP